MRLKPFSLLFLSFSALAQLDTGTGADGACVNPAISNGANLNCSTLSITVSPAFNPGATPVVIKVQGAVTIAADINLNGSAGNNEGSFTSATGGNGGPGAGDGGGDDGGGVLLPGTDASTASGQGAGGGNVVCGDGGGGGGFSLAGIIGGTCAGGGSTPGAAGTIVPSSDFNLNTLFRGGFGGGAGGDSNGFVYGAGGGGGGALHIAAGGDITIQTGVDITANGGNGGNGGPDGGGGGAGSGGAIWLQTEGNFIINGTASLSALGGTGGTATAGAPGGNGGRGLIRIEDLDGVAGGTGTVPGYATVVSVIPPISAGSQSLKSDISCGTLNPNEKNNSALFQMFAGFMFVSIVSFVNRRFRKIKQYN